VALRTGLYPFIAFDILKLLVAAAVMPGVWRAVGKS
jgi:biotin transporter BioY